MILLENLLQENEHLYISLSQQQEILHKGTFLEQSEKITWYKIKNNIGYMQTKILIKRYLNKYFMNNRVFVKA